MTDRLIELIKARVRIPERRTDATDVSIPEIRPAVSVEQLQDCEASLGFPLPLLLRRVYLEIGNGGFGPGYGLFAIPDRHVRGQDSIVEMYTAFKTPDPDYWEWPSGLLLSCDWSCAIYSCVDALSAEQPVFTATEYGVHPTRWTLETWFSDWASNVDLWDVMMATDPGFAPHPVTGRPMEYPTV